MTAHNWTAERIATAYQMYVVEGKSAGVTGRALGVSRNSIIGKAHRLHWVRRPGVAEANHIHSNARIPNCLQKKPRPKAPPKPKPPAPDFPKIIVIPGSSPDMDRYIGKCPKLFEDLGRRDCRWPQGAVRDKPEWFCADPTLEGSSYCPQHASLSNDGQKRTPPKPAYEASVSRRAA